MTMWTKPLFDKISILKKMGKNQKILDELEFLCTMWMFSSLLAKRQYKDNVELITDSAGEEFLIKGLQLPFDSVKVVLDDYDNISSRLWAYGKIVSYSMQNEPFIHIDNDVFITKRFPDFIEEGELIVQHFEAQRETYQNGEVLVDNLFHVPDSYKKYHWENGAYNMGIFGGTDIEFIKKYIDGKFKKNVIIMDNGGSHKSSQVKSAIYE